MKVLPLLSPFKNWPIFLNWWNKDAKRDGEADLLELGQKKLLKITVYICCVFEKFVSVSVELYSFNLMVLSCHSVPSSPNEPIIMICVHFKLHAEEIWQSSW